MVNTPRSYVICHMMTTIDGKIASGIKRVNLFDEYYDLYSKLEQALKPQAWMCGRVTSEEFAEAVGTPLPKTDIVVNADDFKSSSSDRSFMIAVDTKGVLRWKTNTLTFPDQSRHQLIVAVTGQTPADYLAYLKQKDISYIFAGENDMDFSILFKKLKKDFQIDTVALEGGGLLNGSVMLSDLVDEISLIITPLVLNRSNAPVVFENKIDGPVNVKKYKLISSISQNNDSLWLRYKNRKNKTFI